MPSTDCNKVMLKQVASSLANITLGKFYSAASYAASCYIYQPATVPTLELNSAQSLLLALLHSSVLEDVAACIMLSELCSASQQLRSRYLKVWVSEDFNFPPADIKKGLLFLNDLLRRGSIQLPNHVISILSLLEVRYKSSGLCFESNAEEENKLKNAIVHNCPIEISSLMKWLKLDEKKSKLLGSLLHTVVSTNKIEIVTTLIYLKADLEVRNSEGKTPLHLAVIQNNPGIVRILLEAGANTHNRFFKRDTLLHLAAAGGYNDALHALLEGGFDIDSENFLGETALFQATKVGNIAGADILLRKGSDPYNRTADKKTPVEIAFHTSNLGLIKTFLKSGINLDKILESGGSLLHSVIHSSNKEVLELLLEAKPSLEVKNKKGHLPIHVATDPCILEMLVRAGCNINSKTKNGETVLHLAAAKGSIDLVRMALDLGVDLDLKDNLGHTALFIAAKNSSVEIVKLLLEGGATPNININDGWCAIHAAARFGSLECTSLLLDVGVNVDIKCSLGYTPAMFAALDNKFEVIKLLQERGADLKEKNNQGYGLIHCAVLGENSTDAVKFLLDNGIDINAKCKDGVTPLSLAKQGKKTKVIELLQQNGGV